jgi:hypothetical protein
MIKGAQRQMIVVKTADSSLFEEAYFVVRREYRGDGGDMVAEANRLIESCGGRRSGGMRRLRGVFLSAGIFLCGALIGGGIVGALWALLC